MQRSLVKGMNLETIKGIVCRVPASTGSCCVSLTGTKLFQRGTCRARKSRDTRIILFERRYENKPLVKLHGPGEVIHVTTSGFVLRVNHEAIDSGPAHWSALGQLQLSSTEE